MSVKTSKRKSAAAGSTKSKVKVQPRSKGKPESKRQSEAKVRPTFNILAALYSQYSQNFSDYYFSAGQIVDTVKRLRDPNRGHPHFTRNTLRWGEYQKYVPTDPTDIDSWNQFGTGGEGLYKNWEAAIAEARDDLKKLPAPATGPNPDDTAQRAKHLLDHLDTTIKIALFDKYQKNSADPGIEIKVYVYFLSDPGRRHGLTTTWITDASETDPRYKYTRLEIRMTCPNGGWVGVAGWNYDGAQGPITSFKSTSEVPKAPTNTGYGQILFLFNGLESLPDRTQPGRQPGILQPVLQWTLADGWAVRSWYVPANYMPNMAALPAMNDERPFVNSETPAWTRATRVQWKDELTGIITFDGTYYVSKFNWVPQSGNPQEVARLQVQNILPLTVPVAVIEAYRTGGGLPPRDGLVDLDMDDIEIVCADSALPVVPQWDVGSDDPGTNGIHYGTNKLRKYKVMPKYSGYTSSLKFQKK
jgi:hypothetical protein